MWSIEGAWTASTWHMWPPGVAGVARGQSRQPPARLSANWRRSAAALRRSPPSTLPAPEPHHLPTLALGALQTRLGDVRLNSVDFPAVSCKNFPVRLKLSCAEG